MSDPINVAAERLLFLLDVEGVRGLSRGGKSCVWDALSALRPDVAKVADEEGAGVARRRFYPSPDDSAAPEEVTP